MPAHSTAGAVVRLAAPGLDLVISSPDPLAAARFYADVLDADPVTDTGPWRAESAVSFAGQVIAFRRSSQRERTSPSGIYDAIGLRVVAVLVDDLEQTCARMTAAGRRVAKGVDLPGLQPIRFAKDRDGCMLELIGLGGAGVASDESPVARLQVGLTVLDASRSARFYAESVGFTEQPRATISKGVTRHGFDVGRSTLKLWQSVKAPAPRPPDGEPGIESVVCRVHDLDELRRSLDARGVAFEEVESDDDAVLIRDPDGNRIEWVVADRV